MANPLLGGIRPVHPGEVLREDVLPALGKPKAEIARLLGVSRQTLYDLLAERQPVTTRMGLRLGRLLGNGPDIWLRMQQNYDVAVESAAMRDELEAIPLLAAA